ncbi:MAG TPA: Mur ligase family protein, partial [Blastocatellia bacterium]|nr:Mur ligase family protein [Blastocatellia bacterium]
WLHKPVAVKPFDGNQGKGVSLNLYTAEQVVEAFKIASEYSRDVLVEELFVGRDYRVLVVGGKFIAASERIPASVMGDGQHTITELIEAENKNPLRGEGHDFPLTKIEIDEVMIAYLQKSELKLDDVPPAGERVHLRENANLSKGGTAIDVTDIVHPSVRMACERAAQVIGLDVCGVDLVLPDIAHAIPRGGAGIIEINAAPGLRMHVFPSEGEPRDVGAAIMQNLYPFGSSARIPIISITGTNGKTTIARLVAHLLGTSSQRVGLTTTDGIYIDGQMIVAGDTTGPRSAQVILSDPTVEIAVLEVARGGIVRGGLGYDWSDISIMSNIQADHIGQDNIKTVDDILFIKSLVAERVKEGGTLILNADDERLAHLMEIPRVSRVQKRVIYYSLNPQNPVIRQHEERGGTNYILRDDRIMELSGGKESEIVKVANVPLTFGGMADYQISNVMAAVAAARASGKPIEIIAEALMSYGAQNNSGRGNLYRVGNGYVLVDYGHNPEAFAAVGRTLKGLKKKRTTGVIGVPGDRSDEVIKQSGRVIAEYFDRLIIREDKDLRGRKSGEAPEMLLAAAKEANPNIECRIVLDEGEANELAIREMQDDEIIATFYEKLKSVTDVLERHAAVPFTEQAPPNNQQITLSGAA